MLDAGAGADVAHGGDGRDLLRGEGDADRLFGGSNFDTVNGGAGDDLVDGGSGNDAVLGGEGRDRLRGDARIDALAGGAGRDILRGEAGPDTLTGGLDGDLFVFDDGHSGATRREADRITDFSRAQNDTIDLRLMDADATRAGDQAFAFVGSAAFSGAAGELRYDIQNGDALLSGDTNGDGRADFFIRVQDMAELVAVDFVL